MVKLWQFILQLLTSEKHTSDVCWTHQQPFEFKILNPENVARLWGETKGKSKMDYEKFSRGIRYYYDKNIISKTAGKRYVYTFVCDIERILGYNPTDRQAKPGNAKDCQEVVDKSFQADNTEPEFNETEKDFSAETNIDLIDEDNSLSFFDERVFDLSLYGDPYSPGEADIDSFSFGQSEIHEDEANLFPSGNAKASGNQVNLFSSKVAPIATYEDTLPFSINWLGKLHLDNLSE